MKVKKENLLIIASIVWLVAGFNILRIGIEAYTGYVTILNIFLSITVFLIFWFMVFHKLTVKHTNRISMYQEEKQFFLNFFDIKSFCIMAFMMVFGITIRTFNLAPDVFIAVFYTGLGTALFMAGLIFGQNYYRYRNSLNNIEEVDYMKKILNISFVYFLLAMIGGVFYREFTKFYNYSGRTTLGYIHVHLLVLGAFMFLIIALFCKNTELLDNKLFKKYLLLYNIALPFMVGMMLIRGIAQAMDLNLSNSLNGMISGFSGLSHILMMISFIIFFIALRKELLTKN